jgi:hypothetical protein
MARPIKLDADWFHHDKGMRNDARIKAVRRRFGLDGYAIYNMVIETMTDTDGFCIVETPDMLEITAGDFDLEPDKLHEIIEYCVSIGLLLRTTKTPSHLYSARLKRDMTALMDKRNSHRVPKGRVKVHRLEQSRLEQSRTEKKREEENKTLSTEEHSAIALVSENGTQLYHAIEAAFLSKNDDKFSNYGKEGKAIKEIISKGKARAPGSEEAFIMTMLDAFWKLKCSADKFWKGQPFLPSALNASGIWDRVLETMRNEEALADPVAMAVARGERI